MMGFRKTVNYIINIPFATFSNLTGNYVVATGQPFVYGKYYKIKFNYSVNVKTAYAGNMVFAIQDNSAFTYKGIKFFNASTIGIYNGSVEYTILADKNAGQTMNIMFRPYSGIADLSMENITVEEVVS